MHLAMVSSARRVLSSSKFIESDIITPVERNAQFWKLQRRPGQLPQT